jgi:murein DD-endopeptidase MepM/ murein hydrolase activator NlpD
MARVQGVYTIQGSNWADLINAAAERHGIPPRLLLACAIAECGLDETCEPQVTRGMARYFPWPDVSHGPCHQAVAFSPYGSRQNTAANIERHRQKFCGDLPYAFGVAAANLAGWWGKYAPDGAECLGRYNWPARGLQGNPNRGNIERAWAASAQYMVTEEAPVRPYVFPIVDYSGPVNTHWGSGERGGTDLFAPRGADVVAMHASRIDYAGYDALGGYNVLAAGTDGLTYYYAHLDGLAVSTGQRVEAGHRLGPLGDSGNAKNAGPHLHLGIGYGIISGSGPSGGCGRGFDAVGLLQRVLAGGGEENDMARVEELERELAGWQAWWDTLRPVTRSRIHALDDARAGREEDGWDQVKAISEKLHEDFKEEGE